MATAVSGADAPKGPGRLTSALVDALEAHDQRKAEAAERAEFRAWKDGKSKTLDITLRTGDKDPVDKKSTHNGWLIAGLVILAFALLAVFLPRTGTTPAPEKAPQTQTERSPFIDSAPAGHVFVGATKGTHGKTCEERGGKIVPDMSKALEKTEKGFRRPNKCTADDK